MLSEKNYATTIASLPSTGTTSPGNPGMHDDIAAIRSTIQELVIAEKKVVIVLHSAGGFLGSNAIEGLSKTVREEKGLKGGVVGIVFLTAAIFPESFEHGPLPFGEPKVSLTFSNAFHLFAP